MVPQKARGKLMSHSNVAPIASFNIDTARASNTIEAKLAPPPYTNTPHRWLLAAVVLR
jgi:hypothetical protein